MLVKKSVVKNKKMLVTNRKAAATSAAAAAELSNLTHKRLESVMRVQQFGIIPAALLARGCRARSSAFRAFVYEAASLTMRKLNAAGLWESDKAKEMGGASGTCELGDGNGGGAVADKMKSSGGMVCIQGQKGHELPFLSVH